MRKSRKTLMIVSILTMAVIWAFIVLAKGTDLFKGLDLFIFILTILIGIIAFVMALNNDREEKEGLPADDELSNLIKYKSGYYAYLISMYMWLFIFIMTDKLPDIETMLGGGILLSALISIIVKFVIKKNFNA
jgi:peptidoglycan/LPS O-acetylase OafA/YrhL